MKHILAVGALAMLLVGCTPKYDDPNPPRPVKGGVNAAVVVEEYGDFQCPACGQSYGMVKQLQEKFGDQVQWKFVHLPLTSIHPYAFNAAMASECANDQGKFWEMHDILFENQKNLGRSDLYSYAEKVGLNTEQFDACFRSRAKSDTVRADMASAEERGVQSTPSFFINGNLVEDWSDLEGAIQQALGPSVPRNAATNTGQPAVPLAQ